MVAWLRLFCGRYGKGGSSARGKIFRFAPPPPVVSSARMGKHAFLGVKSRLLGTNYSLQETYCQEKNRFFKGFLVPKLGFFSER